MGGVEGEDRLMSRIRTFIGVDPGEEIRQQLVAVQQNLGRETPDVKWVERENLHVTLLFLGEVDDRELPAVCRAVEKGTSSQKVFNLAVEGIGCFPNPRRPRTVWAGIGAGAADPLDGEVE